MNAPAPSPSPATASAAVREPSASILVIEDSREMTELLRRLLGTHGYVVHSARDGEAGLRAALDEHPDLVILDLGLPRRNGLEVAQELRRRDFHAPLLIVTARRQVADRVTGLDAGADDYLAKPFDADELLARVRALLRRHEHTSRADPLRVGDLVLDPVTRELRRGRHPIALTGTEYALLEYLMRHAGRTLSRDTILQAVWHQPPGGSTNLVDVYVTYLRRKIDVGRGPKLLHTVRGEGYVMGEVPAS